MSIYWLCHPSPIFHFPDCAPGVYILPTNFLSFPDTWLFTISSLPSFRSIFIQLKINYPQFSWTNINIINREGVVKKPRQKLPVVRRKKNKNNVFVTYWNKNIETFEILSKSVYIFSFFFARSFSNFFSFGVKYTPLLCTPSFLFHSLLN